jgi:hypothetical protein
MDTATYSAQRRPLLWDAPVAFVLWSLEEAKVRIAERRYEAGQTIYYRGEPDRYLYFLTEGALKIYKSQKRYEGEALPGEKNPVLLVAGRFWWPLRPHKTYPELYPLVVVPGITFVVVIFAVVAVADFGVDRGLSYEQAALEQVGVERLVECFGRLRGQLGVDAP